MEKGNQNGTTEKGYEGKPLFEKETGGGLIGLEAWDPYDTAKNNHDRRVARNRREENIR